METLNGRAKSCSDGKLWYVCTAGGGFTGCCSIDPCTDGVCPDEDSSTTEKATTTSTTSSSTSKSTETTFSSTTSKPTTTTVEPSVTSSSTSSTAGTANTFSTSSSTGILATTSPATATETAVSDPSSHTSNAGMIGGVVGGIIAAIILGILLFCCIKRRRKKEKITVHHSASTQALRVREPSPTTKKDSPVAAGAVRAKSINDSQHSTASDSPSSNENTPISSLQDYNYQHGGPASTVSSLTRSTLSNTSTQPTTTTTYKSLTPLIIPSKPPHPAHPLTPRAAGYVPELSDTGFRRARAELSDLPGSELINKRRPYNPATPPQNQLEHLYAAANVNSQSSTGNASTRLAKGSYVYPNTPTFLNADLTSRFTARKIVTKDGVVMGANLDRMSSIDEIESPARSPCSTSTACVQDENLKSEKKSPHSRKHRSPRSANSRTRRNQDHNQNQNQHVMSFMEYTSNDSESIEMAERGLTLGSGSAASAQSANSMRRPSDAGFGMEDVLEESGENRLSAVSEVLPAYESGGFFGGSQRDSLLKDKDEEGSK